MDLHFDGPKVEVRQHDEQHLAWLVFEQHLRDSIHCCSSEGHGSVAAVAVAAPAVAAEEEH
jgi:hypothetical protein